MKAKDLQKICEKIGRGGQAKLAEWLGWEPSTVSRKVAGTSEITKSDALAIENAVSKYREEPCKK